jgi:glutathione peroxidase
MNDSIYDFSANRIDGTPARLGDYAGKVLLIVNVASECGLTPQYEGLERLYEDQRGRGLEILGFPTNDFGAQEPGTNAEIASFCSTNFGVQFPMFEKISVKADATHPLYRGLMSAQPNARQNPDSDFRERLIKFGVQFGAPSDIMWNFEKFLVGRDGRVVARFAPDVSANDPLLVSAIEAELAKPAT